MKKLLLLLSVTSLVWISSCGDDDGTTVDLDAPSLTATTSSFNLDAGQTVETTINLVSEAGVAQFETEVSDETVISLTVDGAPEVGDNEATLTFTVEALAIGASDITVSVQDAEGDVAEVTIPVVVVAGWDFPFANPYEVLTLRTEFADMKFVIDASGQTNAYTDLAEGGIGPETFFFFGDGWLDEFVENSPFIDSRESMTLGQSEFLAGMFRSQQRDNDATDPLYRNNLVWESLTSATDENIDLGTTASWRNVGVVGNGTFQTLVRPMAYIGAAGSAQIGTFAAGADPATDMPTATASELAVNIRVSNTDTVTAANGATVPYGIIHAFDGFPADIDAAFNDPQGYQETVQGRLRNYRDVSIVQNLMLVDPDVKWTMNAIEDNTTNYSGSSAMYGVVIVPSTVYNDLDAIIRGVDPAFAFGETRVRQNAGNGDTRSVWFWDGGAGHIPAGVYSAAADYWFKHWIPTETIEDGAAADGTYQNFAGDDVAISGSTVTLGGTTVNIVKRARYQDQRVGRWDRAGDGSTLPSQAFQDATGAQGFKWVEVIIVDGSL